MYLKLGADILHVNSGDPETLNPDRFSKFPMIMDIIQHVMR